MTRFKVVSPQDHPPLSEKPRRYSPIQQKQIERTAYYERIWREDPERFDTLHSSMGRDRFERFKSLFEDSKPSQGQKACDLACGKGIYALWMCRQGLEVDAVDIASNALEQLGRNELPSLRLYHEALPFTRREDNAYNIVVCTDFIAELHPHEYRILLSEISRLVKTDGHIICSTSLDIASEDALERFIQLIETEFEILKTSTAFDRLYIRLYDFFAWPGKIAKSSKSTSKRSEAISQRRGFNRWLFNILSHPHLLFLWKALAFLTNPVSLWINQSDRLRRTCEKLSHFFWQENGISHVIVLAKRRALINPEPNLFPHEIQEPKRKKTVWE